MVGNVGARIDLLVDEAEGIIPADNYGYLLEVIGTSIYDGIWVGEQSPIPNIGGIRKDVIDHLKAIHASVIRWPGGCFADAYDWRDGIGPRADRPRRTSYWNDFLPPEVPAGPQRYDPNQFGTDELMQLCAATGGRPFLNVNTRSLEPNVFDRWVEYCNAPPASTTLADQRARNGVTDSYKVRYWGIGNEVWGPDGSLTVEEYLTICKRFVAMVPGYGIDLALVACGAPPGVSLDWVARLVDGLNAAIIPTPVKAVSVHYYAGLPLNPWQPGDTLLKARARGKVETPEPLAFDESGYYWMLGEYAGIDDYLTRHWDVLADVDPGRSFRLAVEEWGAICRKATALSPANHWSRAVTLRDTLGAALTLDAFNRHWDKVMVACFTGLINQEGGLFLTEGDRFVATGIYHVFAMYAAHQGATAVRAAFDVPAIGYCSEGRHGSIAGLSGSASLKGRALTLTVVNPHASAPREAMITLHGGRVGSARMESLHHADIHAQNSFDAPDTLVPVGRPVTAEGCAFACTFPAASVSRLTLSLD